MALPIVFSIKDLVEAIEQRRNNKFDVILAVSGERGNGKSTFLFKLFNRFDSFKPWKQQVYCREDVMKLLEEQQRDIIFDDEAINSGYKRNFFEAEQRGLIQMLNMYRDHFNIYGLAVPTFYNLDKDLRDLVKIHIHVIERGLAIVHMAQAGKLYNDDVWDVAYNKKIEEKWAKKKKKNPNFNPPYHQLTTFRGYIKYGDITKNQRTLYEQIKVKKRKEIYDREQAKKENNGEESDIHINILNKIKEGKLDKYMLEQICLINGLKYSSVVDRLNRILKNNGEGITLSKLLRSRSIVIHSSQLDGNKQISPRLPVV